jgi:signal transduction histidine kinase
MSGSTAPETQAPPLAVYRLHVDDQKPDPQVPTAVEENEWYEPLLRQNAIWFCRLRWMVVAVLGGAGVAGFFPRKMAALGLAINPFWPLATAAILGAMNAIFARLAARAGDPARLLPVRALLWAQIISDLLVLTAVIHWLGSGLPSAPFMYLFHIVLACIVFPPRESLLVAGLAAGFYLVCLVLESLGILARTSVLTGSSWSDDPWLSKASLLFGVGSMFIIWVAIWYLVSRLTDTLRHRERELALTNARLKASSEERAKHMLQTTHQLKAPFATIHAQAQLLLGGYCGALPPAAREVLGKIASRCLALSRQIQEMLQLANLRSQAQAPPPKRELNLGTLAEDVITRVEPAARQRGIRIEREIEPVLVKAVEDHLTMLLDNLVVNAVNYSHDHGVVSVACRAQDGGHAVLVVRDHGIGIPKEKLPRVFDDYYRTDEAVRHNRTSTGLGLAIVRQVAQEARVAIEVESAPGWGTRVTVTLPGRCVAPEANRRMLRNQDHGLLVDR